MKGDWEDDLRLNTENRVDDLLYGKSTGTWVV